MAGPRRTRYLDGLRGLAALQVVLHHTYLEVYPLEQGVHPTGALKAATSSMMLSGLGVSVFLVLSGYALSMAAHRDGWTIRGGWRPFIGRRSRRLVPAYAVALALSIALSATVLAEETGTHWDVSVPFDALDVAGHALLVQDVVGDPYAINHPLWTIAFMLQVYLLFPIFLGWVRRWGVGTVAAWTVAVTTPIAVAASRTPDAVLLLRQLQLVGAFAAGMATLAIVREGGVVTVGGRMRRPPWLAIAMALFAVWAVAPLNHFNHMPFVLAVCCLLVGLGTGGLSPLRGVLEWRGLVWVGGVSYALYLIHGPVVHGVWLEVLRPAGHGVGEGVTLALLLPLAVAASLLAAFAFHRAVERPLAPARVPRVAPADPATLPDRPA